jgi:UDP-N-acetylglucosamine/UDP-N-acetylgalactosamine diphosphorylase
MTSPDAFALADRLARHGQQHLLADLDGLDAEVRRRYLERLDAIDWDELAQEGAPAESGTTEPPRVITLAEHRQRAGELHPQGEAAYRAGRVAVLMVAGGQGTRLGSSGPKGCYRLAPHSGKSIYQLQAEKVLAAQRRFGVPLLFLIMTSPMTDAETREFFAAHACFGLDPAQVVFFSQGTVPSIDREGRALLAAPGVLLENPDGHGGCFTALLRSGTLDLVRRRGVEHLVYIQVDNILAPVDDTFLIGLAQAEQSDVLTKVLEKANPDEKVGHLVRTGARTRIVEYTELSPAQCRQRNAKGQLIYRWGSPAMHCWSVAFLARLADRGYRLPLHRSAKPLSAWRDGRMQTVQGWKCERFIFDLLPEAAISLGLEIERAAEFAPVKNATGVDSAETAVAMASDLYASWLRDAGVAVDLPAAARIEISPRFAATRAQFLAAWDHRVQRVSGDYYLELGATAQPRAG